MLDAQQTAKSESV